MLVADNGYRAIAHDRRGHGRSSQPWTYGGLVYLQLPVEAEG
jgi:alpha-beta hydrolase superfamily lysophospholipase